MKGEGRDSIAKSLVCHFSEILLYSETLLYVVFQQHPLAVWGAMHLGFGELRIIEGPCFSARLMALSCQSTRTDTFQSAHKTKSNARTGRVRELIRFNRVPAAAGAGVGCCKRATNRFWGPGSNPGGAKPDDGSSMRLSGERWWTQGKEQEILRSKTRKYFRQLFFLRFTWSRSGLFVYFWGCS